MKAKNYLFLLLLAVVIVACSCHNRSLLLSGDVIDKKIFTKDYTNDYIITIRFSNSDTISIIVDLFDYNNIAIGERYMCRYDGEEWSIIHGIRRDEITGKVLSKNNFYLKVKTIYGKDTILVKTEYSDYFRIALGDTVYAKILRPKSKSRYPLYVLAR
jgi:hypothetical protein